MSLILRSSARHGSTAILTGWTGKGTCDYCTKKNLKFYILTLVEHATVVNNSSTADSLQLLYIIVGEAVLGIPSADIPGVVLG